MLLSVRNLHVSFYTGSVENEVLSDISIDIAKNEIVGVVGESGSGKSVTSLAIMGLLPKNISKITKGTILFDNEDLTQIAPTTYTKLRGNDIAMIFQEPMSSLNPSMTCGKQVAEVLSLHTQLTQAEIKQKVLILFEKVKLPDVTRAYRSYPHQLSGGQKQRIMIAMAIACNPKLLIADEPTTALDVTVQKDIILLLKELQKEFKMSVLFISHDLALISEIADKVVIMYHGKVIEQGETSTLFKNPVEKYTKALLYSRPSLSVKLKRLPTVSDYGRKGFLPEVVSREDRVLAHQKLYSQKPILEVKNVSKSFYSQLSLFKTKELKAVNNVSFRIYKGETLGLVGESGCGKSTLGNIILRLTKENEGEIFYKGKDITSLSGKALSYFRKDVQLIFQDPFASLNPKMTVGSAIMEPMLYHKLYSTKTECKVKAQELLKQVGLDETHFYRYPHEFSGGQRQRIGIARTIAVQPELIICDESVSALDISVQAQVLNLLNDLKDNYGFTYIFISHDLAVVKYMSDQLIVMNQGNIEEKGDAEEIYKHPKKEYTQKLISAIPKISDA
ncbi:ABC transporter ATP-binding protein [Aquimarina sp. ERC-38]|uniref:ABC transporter ATP-binding protein n=1 Tax=Aquimarina sp. ERC-38 TaxID=2949996 RepID=UPI002247F402|nr:ABC transporter ATP-binding protein [Aquimarina sp. ERC-38]UZO81974.1 ABC transporter ATP-binding protein [Aquimarina sp. ERC-38]